MPDEIFKIDENQDLLHQVITSQTANARRVIAHTKDRSEVRGGGVKPWKQKGTGRARHGSIRSPIWVGGGVTFGPTKERNFSRRIPRKMNQRALKVALSMKAQETALKIVDKLELANPKTREMVDLLSRLFKGNIEKIRKTSSFVLVLTSNAELSKNVALANGNILYSKTMRAKNLNVLDAVGYRYILLDKTGLEIIKERLAG